MSDAPIPGTDEALERASEWLRATIKQRYHYLPTKATGRAMVQKVLALASQAPGMKTQ